jgi:putative spermidine/putrescine transport system permease protein
MTALARLLPRFPAYATPLDIAGWWVERAVCAGVLGFLLLPILVIVPLSFSDSSFLVYPIPGWSLKWYDNLFSSPEWAGRRKTASSSRRWPR